MHNLLTFAKKYAKIGERKDGATNRALRRRLRARSREGAESTVPAAEEASSLPKNTSWATYDVGNRKFLVGEVLGADMPTEGLVNAATVDTLRCDFCGHTWKYRDDGKMDSVFTFADMFCPDADCKVLRAMGQINHFEWSFDKATGDWVFSDKRVDFPKS